MVRGDNTVDNDKGGRLQLYLEGDADTGGDDTLLHGAQRQEIQSKTRGGRQMRKLLFLLKKEFRQIRRNPFLARAIILVPLMQMLILVPAITFEVKRIDLAVTDNDRSPASRELIAKLSGSSFFRISATPRQLHEAEELLLLRRCRYGAYNS